MSLKQAWIVGVVVAMPDGSEIEIVHPDIDAQSTVGGSEVMSVEDMAEGLKELCEDYEAEHVTTWRVEPIDP